MTSARIDAASDPDLQLQRTLTWFFYISLLPLVSGHIGFVQHVVSKETAFEPKLDMLLASWLTPNNYHAALLVALGLCVAAYVVVIWPDARFARVARVAFVLGHVFILAVKFDLNGKIDHGDQTTVWTCVVLVFLPNALHAATDPVARQRYMNVAWFATATILMTYTCAGISKLTTGLSQLLAGNASWLAPEGLVYVVATKGGSEHTLLGELVVEHPVVAYGLQLGTLYLELFAVLAAFRRRLLRVWAIGLIGIHVGVKASMNISFDRGILLLLLFAVGSPFVIGGRWWWLVYDLPVFGRFLAALVLRVGAATKQCHVATIASPAGVVVRIADDERTFTGREAELWHASFRDGGAMHLIRFLVPRWRNAT